MTARIFLNPKAGKQLAALFRSGKRAALAARRAQAIIDGLQTTSEPPKPVAKLSRHGELRLKGCRKYDLGGGYRMITTAKKGAVFILFIGTHDQCHRWMENNRGRASDLVSRFNQNRGLIACQQMPGRKLASEPENMASEDAGDDWLPPLDDQILRRIFCGLTNDKPRG